MASDRSSEVPRPGHESEPLTLSECLADEMAARWGRGERPRAEEFFARHPQLWDQPEEAADLIYEEVCLRRERGEPDAAADALARFPQWRGPLEILFRVHELIDPAPPAPRFPTAGETLAGFVLLRELGRGARGRVFLARQPALADRPVVLKVTPRDGDEHLSLARLQHTNIVPLYSVTDDAARGLRVLCMPYFGGTTLTWLLDDCADLAPADRSGRHLLPPDDDPDAPPPGLPARGAARSFHQKAPYTRAVCWVGAQLADALQYAHDRGLVHLDVKPSNVLVAADGQPMLLDFHLARPPLRPADPPPDWLGGTLTYMPPEQRAALDAVRDGNPVPAPVDGRADVYSLGLVLYESLAGPLLVSTGRPLPRLDRVNPRVSVGLADIIHRCLAADPAGRYPRAGDLAADLRRHLADQPLCGVPNRSRAERWAKWQRRSPHRLPQLATAAAVLLAVGGLAVAVATYLAEQGAAARRLLAEGIEQREDRQHAEALRTLGRGRDIARRLPFHRALAGELAAQWDATRALHDRQREREAWEAEARGLHAFVDRVRFLYGAADPGPVRGLDQVSERCRAWWAKRDRLAGAAPDVPPAQRERVRIDLLDLAVIWADLRAPRHDRSAAVILQEAEEQFGPSVVLDRERRRFTPDATPPDPGSGPEPRTAWEFYALGRSHFRDGNLEAATAALGRAVALEPQGLWPNFYSGVCAFRLGRYGDAATAFTACVALAPNSPECYYNRALAYSKLKQPERALADYDAALRLAPGLGAAALNRGALYLEQKRYTEAAADFRLALRAGADSAPAHYNLALVHHARGENEPAVAALRQALAADPDHQLARALLASLEPKP